MANIPECPQSLKNIQHYLKTAAEHDTRDLVVAYWCRLHALQVGLKTLSNKKTPEETRMLMGKEFVVCFYSLVCFCSIFRSMCVLNKQASRTERGICWYASSLVMPISILSTFILGISDYLGIWHSSNNTYVPLNLYVYLPFLPGSIVKWCKFYFFLSTNGLARRGQKKWQG